MSGISDEKNDHDANVRENESEYVTLAREALESYVKKHKAITVPDWFPEKSADFRAGVFVSLKKRGLLRGCIGTISPTQKNVAEEIIKNAISSGTQDPRFEPVNEDELEELVYSVDILRSPEMIHSLDELDVKRYGVIVSKGFRRGLLLPDLEGVDTPAEQVSIALRKAGISSDEAFEMERFEVVRYGGK
ncbi:MAG: AmmeMemoRadiSam system protein A [Saccharofermentanales bacterium]